MASIISAGTTSGTALNMTGDTSGQLQLATNGSTTALTIDTSQNVGIGTTSPSSYNGVLNAKAADRAVIGYFGGTTYATRIGANGSYATVEGVDAATGVSSYQPLQVGGSLLRFDTGGTERMRIDSSGRVTMPFQTGFIAKGLAAQTTYTAGQVIVFNTASYNVGSGYNTSTGAFTAPVAGLYLFTFQIYLNPGSTNSPVGFYKNGTLEIFCLQGTAQSGIGFSSLISMSASDTVDLRVRVGTGGTATVFNGGDHTQFTGTLLG